MQHSRKANIMKGSQIRSTSLVDGKRYKTLATGLSPPTTPNIPTIPTERFFTACPRTPAATLILGALPTPLATPLASNREVKAPRLVLIRPVAEPRAFLSTP